MLRSMYAAVSGVKAHQTYLDVTGNNIANVNTVGFKRDVVHFRDMIYQTVKNPSPPNTSIPIGGVNPAQIGLGVSVGSIEIVHTQGSLQNTGIPTDMAIWGQGFFVVRNGAQQLYTRAGNFALDGNGNLVMQGNGYLVQGYAYRDMIDPATGGIVRSQDTTLSNVNIPVGSKMPAKATTLAAFRCNLCSTTNSSIADLTSIPGGATQVPRPHVYDGYGGVEVTFVGDTTSREITRGVNGETFFDIETDMVYTWGLTGEEGWTPMDITINRVGATIAERPDPEDIPIGIRDGFTFFDRETGILHTFREVRWRGENTKVGEGDIGTTFPPGRVDGSEYYHTGTGDFGAIHTYKIEDGWQDPGSVAPETINLLNFDIKSAGVGDFYIYNPGNDMSEWVLWDLTNLNLTPAPPSVPTWRNLTTITTPGSRTIISTTEPVGDYEDGDRYLNPVTAMIYEYDGTGWDTPDPATIIGRSPDTAFNIPTAFYAANFTYLHTGETPDKTISRWDPTNAAAVNGWVNRTVAGYGNQDAYIPTVANGASFDYFSVSTTADGTITGNIVRWLLTDAWTTQDPKVMDLPRVANREALADRSGEEGNMVFCVDERQIYTITATGWTPTITVNGQGPPFPGDDGDPRIPQNGQRFFDAGTGTSPASPPRIIVYGPLSGWANEKRKDEDTYYLGKNTLTYADGVRIYSDGSDGSMLIPGVVVSNRVILDDAKRLDSGATLPDRMPFKAGETFLDLRTGRIYTANSTGTDWIIKIPPDEMALDTAYAIRNIEPDENTSALRNIFVRDSSDSPVVALSEVLDSATGNKNVFTYDPALGKWKSQNDTQNGPTALSPSQFSTTTQPVIEKFGTDIIERHDYEDKFTVYDSLGNPHTMVVVFRKVMDRPAEPNASPPVGAESEWDWYAYYTDSSGSRQPQYGQGAGTMVFGDDGLLKRTYTYEPQPPTPNPNATNEPRQASFDEWIVKEKICDPADPRYDRIVHDAMATGLVVADFNVAGAQGSVDYTVNPATYGSNMIRLDFLGSEYAKTLGLTSDRIDGVTSYGSASTTKMKAQDGYEMGVLESWTVSGDGTIMGSYSNNRSIELAKVALAMFANPQGLSEVGETCFAETVNSGLAQVGAPMTGGAGSIMGNTVEMSNVDLTEEFVNLIRAQRGFQANTRVVTTSDQVLEELIHLKR